MVSQASTPPATATHAVMIMAVWNAEVSACGFVYASLDRPAARGSTATAISDAVRATALLMPDATPAWLAGAAASTVAVTGATTNTSPIPNTTTAGSTVST